VDDLTPEDKLWSSTSTDDLWIYDKLILSKIMGYYCGPVGIDVNRPGWYVVRPCVNILGLGMGAEKRWLETDTSMLTPGHFWCEWFEGDHISIDYHYGECVLSVQGFRSGTNLKHWDRWQRVDVNIPLPPQLRKFAMYPYFNCEYIGGKLIECHIRRNPDFKWGNVEFIPVWKDNIGVNKPGYQYVECPDIHGRVGAWIK